MSATFKELNIVSSPLVSASDFLSRIAPIRAEAEAAGRSVIIVYYPSLKKELEEKKINFNDLVLGACNS